MIRNAPSLKRWLLAAGLLLLLVVVALGSFLTGRTTRPGPADAAAARSAPNPSEHDHDVDDGETTYYCSMHPEIRSNDPDDTCPICGMDLVPMPTDGGEQADGDLPVLRLSDRSARLLDVRTTPVERRMADTQVHFVGSIDYDERNLVDVVTRSQGYVEQLHANYLWMPVREGDPLATYDSPAVNAAARELRVVQQSHAAGRNPNALAAVKAKLDRLGVSPDQVQAMLDSDEAWGAYTLRSPIDGVVAELNVRAGEQLGEGGRLMRVADLSTLWLQLEAYETDLPWLRVGQRATFTVQTYPGETFEGTVAFINPAVDPRTRTAQVRIDVPNAAGLLKPGMFARGTVQAQVTGQGQGEAEPPLLIPASAPLITGRRAVVYVRQPDTDRPTFEGRQIVLGPRVGDAYIVREGLAEGEQVVTRGAFKLDSELQIRGRPSMMGRDELFGGEAGHAHGDASAAAEPGETCPVTGLPLDAMGGPVRYEHEGQEILFCCDACPPRFEAEPERYLPAVEQATEDEVHNH
ncbi:MAG: efflux RND transporter periplasmic adaptor subunit [Phycisphaeraceae bacterium]